LQDAWNQNQNQNENEDIDRAIALSLVEESRRANNNVNGERILSLQTLLGIVYTEKIANCMCANAFV